MSDRFFDEYFDALFNGFGFFDKEIKRLSDKNCGCIADNNYECKDVACSKNIGKWIEKKDNVVEYILPTTNIPCENVTVTVNKKDRTLTFNGEKRNDCHKDDKSYSFQSYESFESTVSIPEDIDIDTVSADRENGMVKIMAKTNKPVCDNSEKKVLLEAEKKENNEKNEQ